MSVLAIPARMVVDVRTKLMDIGVTAELDGLAPIVKHVSHIVC